MRGREGWGNRVVLVFSNCYIYFLILVVVIGFRPNCKS